MTVTTERTAPGYSAAALTDGNPETIWLSDAKPARANNTVSVTIDLGTVQDVGAVRWLAVHGNPYPGWGPTRLVVATSVDRAHWSVETPQAVALHADIGSAVVERRARWIRLETQRVGDGTGWALGLREMWIEPRRPVIRSPLELSAAVVEDDVRLRWDAPPAAGPIDHFNLERAPDLGSPFRTIGSVPCAVRQFTDSLPSPPLRYYRVMAVNRRGNVILTSAPRAVFRRAVRRPPPETFALWYQPYEAGSTGTRQRIAGAEVLVGPTAQQAAGDAHVAHIALLPYVTYYQSSRWVRSFPQSAHEEDVAPALASTGFFISWLRYPNAPAGYLPATFSRRGDIEFNANSIQFTLCPNSQELRAAALEHAARELALGADGLFIDNGYEDDLASHLACESRTHKHHYGDQLTGSEAFIGLVADVAGVVKSTRRDAMILVNGGVPEESQLYGMSLRDVADGRLWESYLRTSHATDPPHVVDWAATYARSLSYAKSHQQIFALSYPWNRDEAFFCYATAKLFDFPWAASLGDRDPLHQRFGGFFGTYPELLTVRLGRPIDIDRAGGASIAGVYYREFERGLVAVNPDPIGHKAMIPLARRRRFSELNEKRDGEGSALSLTVPPQTGLVFLWR